MIWKIVGGTIFVLLAAIGLLSVSSHFITDLLWYGAVGYRSVFITTILWRWGFAVLLFLVGALFIGWNLWQTRFAIRQALWRIPRLNKAVKPKLVYVLIAAISLVGGLFLASSLSGYWWEFVQFIKAQSFDILDPVFHKDVSFFFFTLPVLRLTSFGVLILLVLSIIVCGLVYLGAFGLEASSAARKHMGWLAASFVFIRSFSYLFDAYELVYSPEGALYGAGFTDVNVRIWVFRVLMVVGWLAALTILRYAYGGSFRLVAGTLIVWIIFGITLGNLLPTAVQNWVVSPNEFERERAFLDNHINMTRLAYGMDDFEEREFPLNKTLTTGENSSVSSTLQNIRLWDPRPVLPTYQQLQEMRLYYSFTDADVDRYVLNNEYRQVLLSARELDVNRIQNKTWINQHLQYTHGYGVVMSPVNEATKQGLPVFWISDIPPKSTVDIDLVEPRIYFGEKTDQYVIVNTKTDEFDYPLGDGNAFNRYDGADGVYLSTFLHRLAFAMRFGESRILLSSDITPESRVLFDRNIIERAKKLAPFLRYDNDPYIVIHNGRLFWMIDAYVYSYRFPYAQPTLGWGNYIRNSVKVVVDAYNGSIDFYQVEPDALLETYRAVFPNLIKPITEMPLGLREHMRYPEDLLVIQARMYGTYHMTDTRVFYNREDVWSFAREIYADREQEVLPYYVMMEFPDGVGEEMVLMMPFIPARRNNMVAWLGARNDGENYGNVVVFKFPKDTLTLGPAQVEARIDQDPEISQLLSLWGRSGSQVIRGNLLVLPVGASIIYVEPLYLQSEQSGIPQLQRVIAADQDELVMAENVETALELLLDRVGVKPDTVQKKEETAVEQEPSLDWSSQAYLLYEGAAQSLRQGDFGGFGEAWEALGELLRELNRE